MAFGSILLAALGIGLLIFLHEAGHFLAARAIGVRVEVFSLGFGPRLAGFSWRGTDFRLSAVPFGGYVMVAGQDPGDRRYPAEVSLHGKSVAQRALFWSGGVVMNALFALVAFPIVFHAGVNFEAAVAGPVRAGTAAWEAGIAHGDRIVEVAGKPVHSFQSLLMEIALRGNRPVELLVENGDGERRLVTAEPHYHRERGVYDLGIAPAFDPASATITVPADGPAAAAGLATGDLVVGINGKPPTEPGSIDGIGPVAVDVLRKGQPMSFTLQPRPVTTDVPPLIGVMPLRNQVEGLRPGLQLVEQLGVARGDRVLAIDGRPFLSGRLEDFATGPAQLTMLVLRDGEEHTLSAPAGPDDRKALADHVAFAPEVRLQLHPQPDGAAEDAGILAGDWVEAIDGKAIHDWEDLRTTVQAAGDRQLEFRLRRPDPNEVVAGLHEPTGKRIDVVVKPKVTPQPELGWQLQLLPRMQERRADSFGEAVGVGVHASLDLVKQLYVTLKRLLTGEVGANNLGGIIRISEVSYQAAQRGPSWFWYFMALLSVNLAFVNLLPIPVLDGGHLMFLLIEKVKGSPVSSTVFGYSQVIGLVFVLLLVLFVTYNDILRLL